MNTTRQGDITGFDDAEVVDEEEDNTKRNRSCYVCPWRDECDYYLFHLLKQRR